MRQLLTGVVTLILGFFTLVFAAVFGLFVSVTALIAKPFVMKKLRKMQEQQYSQTYQQTAFGESSTGFGASQSQQGRTIDGDFKDVTDYR